MTRCARARIAVRELASASEERKELADQRLVGTRAIFADLERLGAPYAIPLLRAVPLHERFANGWRRTPGAVLPQPAAAGGGIRRHFLEVAGDPGQPLVKL